MPDPEVLPREKSAVIKRTRHPRQQELEDAYQQSCQMHGIPVGDPTYTREYIFDIIAIFSERLERVERLL